MGVSEKDLEALYALPRDDFIPSRTELARRLKAAGRSDEAARVAKLRKPTVTAWAVNQLARKEARTLGELVEAGEHLKKAQRSGKDLRTAAATRRRLIDRLVQSAAAILVEAGHGDSPSALQGVAYSLEAIATDADTLDQVRRGVLEKELPAPAGFGGMAGLQLVPEQEGEEEPRPKGRRPAPPKVDPRARQKVDRLTGQAETAEEEARSLADAAAKAERAAIRARNDAQRAEDRARKARERADRAAAELEE
jgi:hypothetical protein